MLEYQLLGIPVLEWIGYAASVLVLISLSMASIVKLRWYNMIGAILFSTYGFLIGSLPVGIMNFLIVCANIYNLRKMYKQKEDFKIIEIKENDELLKHFLEFYAEDIRNYFPQFKKEENQVNLFVLRNMSVAGIFIGQLEDNNLKIELDYALPQYRDFKVGSYLYEEISRHLEEYNITNIYSDSTINLKYLKKMGFQPMNRNGKSVMHKKTKKPLK
jgi:GNAT superfamily N-acetyltransferase